MRPFKGQFLEVTLSDLTAAATFNFQLSIFKTFLFLY